MRVLVVGAGAVGARAARQLHGTSQVSDLVIVDTDATRAADVAASLGSRARPARWSEELLEGARVAVLATPAGEHRSLTEAALEGAVDVVSVSDEVDEVGRLLDLDAEARERGRRVVIGAAFSPGLSCLLSRHAAGGLSVVDEVHVAGTGTGGPACARQHHRALAGDASEWRDGAWARRAAGSGRELCWFPDPIGGLDSYRAALPHARLLLPAFPTASRITAKLSASRRDRLTARLPMLRRPHREGALGAIRVEVRGRRGAATDARVMGALDRPAVAAGAVAAVAALWIMEDRMAAPGAAGLAVMVPDPVPFLHALAQRGVRAAVFEGTATSA